jgi:hypothetical protein
MISKKITSLNSLNTIKKQLNIRAKNIKNCDKGLVFDFK